MNQSRPLVQHADAVYSTAFTGNLRRASLLPGEIAVLPPVSQEIRAAIGTGGYPQPAGANLYRQQQDGGPMIRDAERPWWHWPALAAMACVAYALLQSLSDGVFGADLSALLHRLI